MGDHISGKRKDSAYRDKEADHISEKRKDPAYQEEEAKVNKKHKADKRKDPAYREKEADHISGKRKDQAYREKEADHISGKRKDPAYREKERVRDKLLKQRSRLDPTVREKARAYINKKREEATFRAKENVQQRMAKKLKSHAEKYHFKDKYQPLWINGVLQSSYYLNRNPDIADIEKTHRKVRQKFFEKMQACAVCDQLWYPHSGKKRRKLKQFVCNSCFRYVNKVQSLDEIKVKDFDKIPPLSSLNNVRMNEIPPELEGLNDLELRLLAPRQIFIWMHAKPVSGEPYVRGNLVLVPADPQQTLKSMKSKLTIPLKKSDVIRIDLKRRLTDKKNHISHTIRPHRVIAAAKALANTELYKELDIKFDESWDSTLSHKDVSEEFIARKFGAKPGPCYYRKDEVPAFDLNEEEKVDDLKEENNANDLKKEKDVVDIKKEKDVVDIKKEKNVDILNKEIKKESEVEVDIHDSAINVNGNQLKEGKPNNISTDSEDSDFGNALKKKTKKER